MTSSSSNNTRELWMDKKGNKRENHIIYKIWSQKKSRWMWSQEIYIIKLVYDLCRIMEVIISGGIG